MAATRSPARGRRQAMPLAARDDRLGRPAGAPGPQRSGRPGPPPPGEVALWQRDALVDLALQGEDDRSLARMLGAGVLLGTVAWALVLYGLWSLLT